MKVGNEFKRAFGGLVEQSAELLRRTVSAWRCGGGFLERRLTVRRAKRRQTGSLRYGRPEVCVTVVAIALCLLNGCSFAPKYHRPTVQTPSYKEAAPAGVGATNVTAAAPQLGNTNQAFGTNIWQPARPGDEAHRGKWWTVFNDAQLNALEEQVAISNQNVVAAFANFLSARAIVKETRAQLFPTLTANPDVARSRQAFQGTQSLSNGRAATFTQYSLPLDASWQLDLWGRIRNAVNANAFEAQATAADLENTRLTAQGELAVDYFELRAQDALKQLYADTVSAYQESYNLTVVRFQTGIASDEDVAQAETQLKTAEAQATNLGILRSQLEHAIAMLTGKAPAEVSLAALPLNSSPPQIPPGLPSQLLERRPDIAAAERRVAEANAQIGVGKAAYFPNITLSASGGLQSVASSSLLEWSSRFWSIGAGLAETIFDAGQRRAVVQQYQAAHAIAVAHYRQTVLSAFQQVEDNLSSIRILTQQAEQQKAAVEASQRYLNLARDRYKLGIDSYLNVITAQAVLLQNSQTLVNVRSQQMTATVQLIEALGGGWEESQLPAYEHLVLQGM